MSLVGQKPPAVPFTYNGKWLFAPGERQHRLYAGSAEMECNFLHDISIGLADGAN